MSTERRSILTPVDSLLKQLNKMGLDVQSYADDITVLLTVDFGRTVSVAGRPDSLGVLV